MLKKRWKNRNRENINVKRWGVVGIGQKNFLKNEKKSNANQVSHENKWIPDAARMGKSGYIENRTRCFRECVTLFLPSLSTVHPLGPHASKHTHSHADFYQSPGFFVCFSFKYFAEFTSFFFTTGAQKSWPGIAVEEKSDFLFVLHLEINKKKKRNIKKRNDYHVWFENSELKRKIKSKPNENLKCA